MFGDPLLYRRSLLVVVLLLGCAATASNGRNLCDVAPDEATMLQVVKPVARAIFKCIDDVILPFKVRGELASVTKEGRNEATLCLKKYVEEHLECFVTRLDLPMENEKKSNAVLHWFFEIVRP
ncbi:hypothetical protein MTO96_016392 [Rhipicephalus appendiculatus]